MGIPHGAKGKFGRALRSEFLVQALAVGFDGTGAETEKSGDGSLRAFASVTRKWILQSEIFDQTQVDSIVDLSWDGSFGIDVPSHPSPLTSPNFNEVGVSVDFTISQIDPNVEEGEPIPVWSYVSPYLVLRADNTNLDGNDFVSDLGSFPVAVEEFDVDNPFNPTGNFFNTGTVDLVPVDPAEGSFTVVPEPAGYGVFLGILVAALAISRRRR